MHFTSLTALTTLLSLGLRVSAHGFPVSLSVAGTQYPGANGPSASGDSPFRKVSTGDPVTDVSSDNLICGQNAASTASSSASVNPGDTLQFAWAGESGGNWFHNAGPIITYMAACSGSCASFTPSASTAWFKIAEDGESTPGDASTWAQAKLLSGAPANATVPTGLAPGEYLVRHEIIALQNSQTEGGAEFYPSCVQVTVKGSGGGKLTPTVNFPGEYKATDAGILGNFYNPGTDYTFPGGPIATIGGSSSGSDSGSGSSSSSPASASSTATGTAASPSSTAGGKTSTKCSVSSSKKRRLARRSSPASGNANGTSTAIRQALKMHRRRSDALSY